MRGRAGDEPSRRAVNIRSNSPGSFGVTISAGVAQRFPNESSSSLVERADAALYSSKRNGRNRVTNAELASAAA